LKEKLVLVDGGKNFVMLLLRLRLDWTQVRLHAGGEKPQELVPTDVTTPVKRRPRRKVASTFLRVDGTKLFFLRR
jgi:hypothetical protein